MVRHGDAIHAGVHRCVGILGRLNALERNRSVLVLSQERDVRPRTESTQVILTQLRNAKHNTAEPARRPLQDGQNASKV